MRRMQHGIDCLLGHEPLKIELPSFAFDHHLPAVVPWLADILGLVRVGGTVADPALYPVAALQALPAQTETVTYTSAGTPVTNTFTGTLLWDVLTDAGGVTTDPAAKNDGLSNVVVATGSDGYRAVFSIGEIDPRFGGEQILVAYDDAAGQLGWLREDGSARMVVPGDTAGGRYVSHLIDLEALAGPAFSSGAGGTSDSFTLGGAVAHASSFDLVSLAAHTSVSMTTTYAAGGTPVTDTFTGVALWDLLGEAGILTDPAVRNDSLGFYVVATGSDGYRAAFSLGEIDPRFGNGQILVAYDDTLGRLGEDGRDGFARLVVPGDAAGGRYISNLTSIEVIDIDHPPSASQDVVWA